MKNIKTYLLLTAISLIFASCQSDDSKPVANNVTLAFNNTLAE